MAGSPLDLLQIMPAGPAVFPAIAATVASHQSDREWASKKQLLASRASQRRLSLHGDASQVCADLHLDNHRTNPWSPRTVRVAAFPSTTTSSRDCSGAVTTPVRPASAVTPARVTLPALIGDVQLLFP